MRPLDAHLMLRRHWQPALKRAHLEPGTVHDLRHTYASWLRQAGVDLEVVQRLLGHATILTTQRYTHFGADAHRTARDALDG